MRGTQHFIITLLIALIVALGLLVLELPRAHGALTGDMYCAKGNTFPTGRAAVFPWGVATRAQHVTQYNLNYRTEYGFYDVPVDHPLYAELEKFILWDIVPEKCPHILGLTDTLTRGELATIIAKLGIYTNRIPGMVLPMNAPFKDVPLNDRYAITLSTLQTYDVIDSGSTFRPNAAANKIEAITMMARLYDLDVNPNVKLPFRDVQNSWYTPYLQAAYSNGFLAPMTELQPSKILSKEDFFTLLAYVDKKDQVVVKQDNKRTVAARNEAVYGPSRVSRQTQDVQPTQRTKQVKTNTLAVTKSKRSTITVNAGSRAVNIWDGTLTNGYTTKKIIQQLSFSVIGILPPGSVRNITLHVGEQTVNGVLRNRTITFFDPVELAASSTVPVSITADFEPNSIVANFSLSLGAKNDLMLFDRTTLSGSFPVQGPTVRLNQRSASIVTVRLERSNTMEIQEHTDDVFLHTLRFSSSEPNTDMRITQLRLRARGSMDLAHVTDLQISDHYRGTPLGDTVAELSGDMVTFDFTGLPDGGILLKDGRDVLLDLSANLGDANDETLSFEIDDTADIVVEDIDTGVMPLINPDLYNDAVEPLHIREHIPFRPADYYYRFN